MQISAAKAVVNADDITRALTVEDDLFGDHYITLPLPEPVVIHGTIESLKQLGLAISTAAMVRERRG